MDAASRDNTPPIVVLGGGPIGLTCALLLAERGFDCRVIEARPLAQARRERRLLALSQGSLQVLARLLGERAPPLAPIRHVHVSSAGEFGTTLLTDADAGGEPLGATAYYGELIDSLDEAAQRHPGVQVMRECDALGTEQRPDRVAIEVRRRGDAAGAGATMVASLAIHAEGQSPAGSAARAWALVADVMLTGARADIAYERFTREGPLALLPAPGPAGTFSLVWCADEAAVRRRSELPEQAFLSELNAAIGPRLAACTRAGPRFAHALAERARARLAEHRAVWLGNAAQTLHPVAGQGFNLGVRDCIVLADALAARRVDLPAAVQDYARRRERDRAAIGGVTRWLPDLFRTRAAPVALARMLGLTAIDLVPAARRQLATLLMFGVRG
jgi:2-octaprenyl-6-methoxyphenol hydroxylase